MKAKPTKPPVDYQTVKSGFVDRQGEMSLSGADWCTSLREATSQVTYAILPSLPSSFPGLLWKKWNHQWMTLDEGGSVLRWYKNEQRGGFDGQIYMK